MRIFNPKEHFLQFKNIFRQSESYEELSKNETSKMSAAPGNQNALHIYVASREQDSTANLQLTLMHYRVFLQVNQFLELDLHGPQIMLQRPRRSQDSPVPDRFETKGTQNAV